MASVPASDGLMMFSLVEGNVLGLRPERLLGFLLTPESMLFHKGQYPMCNLPEPKFQWYEFATFSWQTNHLWIMSWYNSMYHRKDYENYQTLRYLINNWNLLLIHQKTLVINLHSVLVTWIYWVEMNYLNLEEPWGMRP